MSNNIFPLIGNLPLDGNGIGDWFGSPTINWLNPLKPTFRTVTGMFVGAGYLIGVLMIAIGIIMIVLNKNRGIEVIKNAATLIIGLGIAIPVAVAVVSVFMP